MKNIPIKSYSPLEERCNIISHAIGLGLSVVALILLLIKASTINNSLYLAGVLIYGCSLIMLYGASTFYHRETNEKKRKRLKILDHSAIYVLIAGTATPILMVSLHDHKGLFYLCILWGIALLGILFKLFFTGRFKLASTISYVLQGWILVIAFAPIHSILAPEMLNCIFWGGIAYTLGAVLYMIKRIPFNHAIFHIFVLAGSFFHFLAIYKYV